MVWKDSILASISAPLFSKNSMLKKMARRNMLESTRLWSIMRTSMLNFSLTSSSLSRMRKPWLLNLISSPSMSKQLWSTSLGRAKFMARMLWRVSSTMPRLMRKSWSAYEVPPRKKLSTARVSQNLREKRDGSLQVSRSWVRDVQLPLKM